MAHDPSHHAHGHGHHAHGHGGPIDIHAHLYPLAYMDAVKAKGARSGAEYKHEAGKGPSFKVGETMVPPLSPQFYDMDARLEAMDRQGVKVHALSLSLPMVHWADRALSQELAETYNDAALAMCERHPDRFVNLATLPAQEPDLALAEIARVKDRPSTRGWYLSTHICGRDLSDEHFFPMYEAMEASGLPAFLHPCTVIGHSRLTKFYLQNLLGNPYETGIAAAHLIFGDVLDRFPKLTWVLPHAGGAFPYLFGRLQRGVEKRPELAGRKKGPVDYLRHFYYDTIGYHDAPLKYLKDLVGADRIMMGSDYCYPIAYERPVDIVTAHPHFNADEQQLVLEGNARRLLGI